MISSRTCSARSMSSYPIAHKCSDFVIVVLLCSRPAAADRGTLSRLLGPIQLHHPTRDASTRCGDCGWRVGPVGPPSSRATPRECPYTGPGGRLLLSYALM